MIKIICTDNLIKCITSITFSYMHSISLVRILGCLYNISILCHSWSQCYLFGDMYMHSYIYLFACCILLIQYVQIKFRRSRNQIKSLFLKRRSCILRFNRIRQCETTILDKVTIFFYSKNSLFRFMIFTKTLYDATLAMFRILNY